jgi:hypothetical protein
VLADIPAERWERILTEGSRPLPWVETRLRLGRRFALDEAQLDALRAHLARRVLERAFLSASAGRRARRGLARLADLTPGQVEGVLALAGARRLMHTPNSAFPPLIDLLEDHPELALPLLKHCVASVDAGGRAARAARQLEGAAHDRAERTLRALGPFGLEALRALTASRGGHAGPRAERLQRELERQWPPGKDAVEMLGRQPELWRRWYRGAREVL